MISNEQDKMNELLFRLLDNEISDDEFAALKELLDSDPRNKQHYCQFMSDYSALMLRVTTDVEQEQAEETQNDLMDDRFWNQLHEEEKNAPALVKLESDEQSEHGLIRKVEHEKTVRRINKTSLLIAVLSAAALFLMIVYVSLAPSAPYEVASISDSINAQWSSDLSLTPGVRISTNSETIHLTRGIVKLMTDDQVEVVLEAPSEFKFISYSEIKLQSGKLFARVSEQGLGFSVATANSKIVDLGTEFGVLCHPDGNTEVFMYKGKANLFAGLKNAGKTSQMLMAGSARRVSKENSTVQEIVLDKQAVVRNVDSKTQMVWKGQMLSLADMVGGGDGFKGGLRNQGIEVSTGRVLAEFDNDDTLIGDEGYNPVSENPYVDGVFVPGTGEGPTQITSTGLMTDQFPMTSGLFWGTIFNGAMHKGTTTPQHSLQLDGTVYGTDTAPAITIHANQGITFDLSKIRQRIPQLAIREFRSLIGVSETVGDALQEERFRSFEDYPEIKKVFDANCSKAEFWVFVDGRPVCRKTATSLSGSEKVQIPITENDRFLTLVVTEADDTHGYDWALFGCPELVLESINR